MSGTGTVSALFVRPILAVFGDKPPTEFWDTTGLTSAIVADPQARLSMLQFAAAWNELARLSNDPQIALRMAATILPVRVGTYGVFDYLGLTPRSLQRRLKDEHSSYRVVRDEVRRDLAISYLERQLPVTEISFLLGFSDPSAFCRAFKRWTGVPPLESRSRNASRP